LPYQNTNNKQVLRAKLRQLRAKASQHRSEQATFNTYQALKHLNIYRKARHIGVYVPMKNEFPVEAIFNNNLWMNKRCYIPIVFASRNNRMKFVFLNKPDCKLLSNNKKSHKIQKCGFKKNRFNILEPAKNSISISAKRLDIVFVPLLGFDDQGNRLGMGGGFYDRFFAFKNWHNIIKRPVLIGLAYECQQEKKIETESWDIALDIVITEERTYQFNSALH